MDAENLTENPAAELDADATGLESEHECACAVPLAAFDELIAQVRAALPADARSFAAAELAEVPVAVGEHAGRGVVLKSRCAVELGGACGSTAMVLSTGDAGLVHDGRVTVAGPDVSELPVGSEVPFAQVVLVAGSEVTGPCHQVFEDCQTVKDWIENYFVRCAPGDILTRVGTAAHGAGFGFAHLGRALIELVRHVSPLAEAVEVFFVTSSREDVERLAALERTGREISHDLRHEAWMEKGVDIDCARGGHCGKCSDRDVCTQVRKIERMRKRLAELDEAGEDAEQVLSAEAAAGERACAEEGER